MPNSKFKREIPNAKFKIQKRNPKLEIPNSKKEGPK
jgi:hypothetical protein